MSNRYFTVTNVIGQTTKPIEFATNHNIAQLYCNGIYLHEVFPLDEILTTEKNLFGEIYSILCSEGQIDNFNLGPVHSLFEVETYEKFGLNIVQNNYLMDFASYYNRTDLLEWCANSGMEFKYTCDAIDWASANGHTETLNWWFNSGLNLIYSNYAMDMASKHGHVKILKCWINSGFELKYTRLAIYNAFFNNKFESLIWWTKSGLKIPYCNEEIAEYIRKNCIRCH